ncbi:MAG TPA: hypothetical protein VFE33_32425, partial [Thermoanaerobaculia bacterium]|nr:hypothetical protein [Thermoanaerobaculia bacterium]
MSLADPLPPAAVPVAAVPLAHTSRRPWGDRFRAVFGLELRGTLSRPMVWVLLGLLVLICWLMSQGALHITSG